MEWNHLRPALVLPPGTNHLLIGGSFAHLFWYTHSVSVYIHVYIPFSFPCSPTPRTMRAWYLFSHEHGVIGKKLEQNICTLFKQTLHPTVGAYDDWPAPSSPPPLSPSTLSTWHHSTRLNLLCIPSLCFCCCKWSRTRVGEGLGTRGYKILWS